jgi:CheY-like chemotaxis protein
MAGSRLILLVEDNPDDVELTLRALRKNHISTDVAVARDGVEALEYLLGAGDPQQQNARKQPALVLLDLKLPKIDGLEVLRRIRGHESTRLLPVVILTLSNEEQDISEAYRLGANSYLRKPVDFDSFNEVLIQIGRYWLDLNELPPRPRSVASSPS